MVETEIECPQCGDVGAVADSGGFFYDGQALVCGCHGQVSMCAETEPDIVIFNEEEHRFCADTGTVVLKKVGNDHRWYLGLLKGNDTDGYPEVWVIVTDRQAKEVSELLREQGKTDA